MTGFGTGSAEGAGLIVSVELRSVNHKHLAAKLRLPGPLASLEGALEARLRAVLARGAISATVAIRAVTGENARFIDRGRGEALLSELKDLAEKAGLEPPRVEALLSVQGIVRDEAGLDCADAAEPVVKSALEQALDRLVAARVREGEALECDLRQNLIQVSALAGRAGELTKAVQARHILALRERVATLMGREIALPEADLAREIAVLADRMDVSEELTRLSAHVIRFEELLAEATPAGRALDFLCQELFREANTLGTKCADAEVAHLVVELKGAIERLREQAQNVE